MTDQPDEEASEEQTARRLIEGLSHAVFMLDTAGRLTTWPQPAQSLYGHDAGTVLGQKLSVLFAEDTDSSLSALLEEATDGAYQTTVRQSRADGSEFWATLTLTPLRDGDHDGYAVVSHDTTAQRRETERLRQQNDRLKEFTDILAHDLRSPLEVIDGQLRLYRETGATPHLETIAETTNRMEALVDDLLTVAEHGSAVADPDHTDTTTVINTAWEAAGHNAPDATLRTTAIGPVYADAQRLHQLFQNLFQNAIDHAGPAATVSVGPLDSGFYLEDDGPGIPSEQRDKAVDHGFSTSDGGTGYGLSIVRTIANAHGWDLTITRAESGGARIEITGVENLEHTDDGAP